MHNKLAVTGGSRRLFKGKLCLAGLLMLLFWHLLPIQGLAADGGRQMIRVGYPIQLGMTLFWPGRRMIMIPSTSRRIKRCTGQKRKDTIRILSPEPPYFSEHFNLKKENTKKV